MGVNLVPQPEKFRIGFDPLMQRVRKRGHACPDIANQLDIRMENLFQSRRDIPDISDHRPRAGFTHEKRRLLDRVVTDRDDEVGRRHS